jgi:hypothetical protein
MGESTRKRCRRAVWPARGLALLTLALLAGPSGAETRTVVVGARYQAGKAHRFLLGTGYRELWTTPIQVEALDLARFSGGLTARKKGGGLETTSLRLEGRDGRKWKFRSVDKDPSRGMPENLRGSLAEKVVQDEVSASRPLGSPGLRRPREGGGDPVRDPDRHQLQWDWARSAATGRWVTVPKDRDLAFVRFDGLLVHFVRSQMPHLVKFDEKYPAAIAFDLQSGDIDRLFLGGLDWPAWRQVAGEFSSRLTDPVVDAAVKRLPAPYDRLDGARLAARLKARRDGLEPMARRLYQLLAREAEVYGTDQADTVQILRQADGSVEVALTGHEGRYFQRRYLPGETREVRVFLKGGDDHVVSEGQGDPKVIVRVVCGDGDDVIDDSAAGHCGRRASSTSTSRSAPTAAAGSMWPPSSPLSA